MITFYPGPSRLHNEVETYLGEAFHSGILSMNHRSKPFMDLLADTMVRMKEKLLIPQDYQILFNSSATECWEIVAQSLTAGYSYHFYNGAFGEKWCEYAHRIHGRAEGLPYAPDDQPAIFPANLSPEDLLCFTHTETSNGAVLSDGVLAGIREKFEGLIAIDATSSMGGVHLPWSDADIWYASVQKCFGLPSGLAVMVLSPKAVDQAYRLGENAHYNSLPFVIDNFRKFQTPYTPNILGIFLMNRLMKSVEDIRTVDARLRERSGQLYAFLEENGVSTLIKNPESRSSTVVAVQESEENVATVKAFVQSRGIMLGNGYGTWKATTYRIANFPAIPDTEFEQLRACLYEFWHKS